MYEVLFYHRERRDHRRKTKNCVGYAVNYQTYCKNGNILCAVLRFGILDVSFV